MEKDREMRKKQEIWSDGERERERNIATKEREREREKERERERERKGEEKHGKEGWEKRGG